MTDWLSLLLLLAVLGWVLCLRYQRQRIAFLGQHLAGLKIEHHMGLLTQGYLRAIHEDDPQRQAQIWDTFAHSERSVAEHIERLSAAIAQAPAERTRIGRWALCLPYVEQLLPSATRDFKALLRLHAQGVRAVVDNTQGLPPKARAYQLMAELLLLQHSCHWFCKSRLVADARLQARHQVTHQKVLDSVSDATAQAYRQWLQRG
ncbi:hypothetical protein EII19_01475 [Comamonadaceae bacterium OH2310_COT-174]|nr:hypothetical protein EII19_01475 [Comamonadaceae bacterium OH2310_COT-174]